MSDKGNRELADRVRDQLRQVAGQGTTTTYQALAEALALRPPNTIHQVAMALEYLMREDAAADRPFIAALVTSKTRRGLPAAGFFDLAQQLGRFEGDPSESAMRAYHQAELDAARRYWRPMDQPAPSHSRERE